MSPSPDIVLDQHDQHERHEHNDWHDRHEPAGFAALREAYLAGELVVFVGAGVSIAAGLPSWSQLIEQMLAGAAERGAPSQALAACVAKRDEGRFSEALAALREALPESVFRAEVARLLDDRGREVPEVARALASLAPRLRGVLTTNLDCILERAFPPDWTPVARAAELAQRERYILKLHGTLADPSTWILTRDQYARAIYADPHHQATFSAIFHRCPLMFVGYGLADDDFDHLLGRVRADGGADLPCHHALVEAATLEPERADELAARGLRVLPYPNPDGSHQALVRLLHRLRDSLANPAIAGAAQGR